MQEDVVAKDKWKQDGLFGGIVPRAAALFEEMAVLDEKTKIETINRIKQLLHEVSPMKGEPVDCVLWVPAETVQANDYNPNSVAPPEMRLLEVSILEDGYTQPIVTHKTGDIHEVVDGFHRNRVGKECKKVAKRIKGYLPVVVINEGRQDRGDRIAATIRHNRARGKHKVEAMSDIVIELKRRNWTDERIARDLGMDQDEILRLCQITGLADLFSDQEFSKSWDIEGDVSPADFELSDDIETYGEEAEGFRTLNTDDKDRIFHTHDKWECFRAGFYATTKEGMTAEECQKALGEYLADPTQFEAGLKGVVTEWKHSCEHYLTNSAMNRIAWLGQAAACYSLGIPSTFRGGFNQLSWDQQYAANMLALRYLNDWLEANGRNQLMLGEAIGRRQSEIY